MKVEEYRGVPFLYREKEISFLIKWFSEPPQRILFIYGPKSSGKTTIIEYFIENKLLESGKHQYWLKYINMRRKFINNYRNFLDSFILPSDVYEEEIKKDRQIGIRVFKVSKSRIERIRRKEMDFSEALIEEVSEEKEKGKKPIIIVDEIQELRDVYIENGNNERQLLKKFLSFSVSLTKELHLSHVVILTSNTVFIERIYNDAKMKETSEFMKIGHLSRDEVYEWLGEVEGIKGEDIELIWEYVGGNISRIMKTLREYRKGVDIRAYLERERWLAYTEIDEYLASFDGDEEAFFIEVARKVINNGYYSIEGLKENRREILHRWAEKEILFYDPLELKVMGNSRIYEKGMELLLERRKK